MKLPLSPLPTISRRLPRRPLAALALVVLCLGGLAGCADDNAPRDNTAMLPSDQKVSSLPWNQQQGWENTSKLGALANDPRIGGRQ